MILSGRSPEADFGFMLRDGVSVVFEGDAVFMGQEEACAVDVEAGWGWCAGVFSQRCSCWTDGGLACFRVVALDENVMFPLMVSDSGGDEVAGSPWTCADR